MNQLYLLQFVCCILTAMFALMLVISRFQVRWVNKRYETSRWLLAFSMFMLSLHYVLQMVYDIRAKSDEMGALFNILFYSPISLVVSYATYHLICNNPLRRKRYIYTGTLVYSCILALLLVGTLARGGEKELLLGTLLPLMMALFIVGVLYSFWVNIVEMRRCRKLMEEDTGADLLPYDRYSQASYIMMGVSVMILMFAIFYRPMLYILGPLMMLSIFIFTMSFIAYGFNIMPSDTVQDDVSESEEEKTELQEKAETEGASDKEQSEDFTAIEQALNDWCAKGGFRDSTVNMIILSRKLDISKKRLIRYFESYPDGTFRTWLSDVRFQEAQRMLLENPYFNIDTISAECGFSSHAHLYKMFKAKMGMTPRQWRLSVKESGAASC